MVFMRLYLDKLENSWVITLVFIKFLCPRVCNKVADTVWLPMVRL
jgi:hypothetical protein